MSMEQNFILLSKEVACFKNVKISGKVHVFFFNARIFWILVYTIRKLIFKNFSADSLFYLKKIGNHLNHILSQIKYSDMLCGILLVHLFFIKLFTEAIIYILFLWKAVANIFWARKYLVNCYPHKFTILLLEWMHPLDHRIK